MTTQPKYATWPLIGPLLVLLSSQELILALLAIALDYLVWVRPELEEVRGPAIAVVTSLLGLILTGRLAARLDGFTSRGFWMAILRPFRVLLQSRKFWVAVGTLVTNILIAVVPELEEIRVHLMSLITLVGLGLMTNIAWEDTGARKDVTPAVEKETAGAAAGPTEIPRLSDDETIRVAHMVRAMVRGELPNEMSIDELVDQLDTLLNQRGLMIVPNPKAMGGERRSNNPPLAMVG